jgi:site-specific recombinase XerD
MTDKNLLGPWIRRFLLEHLVTERNLARNTQASYRDTLTLLLPFASAQAHRAIDQMTVEDLTSTIVRRFLEHIEADRRCSGSTRNQRLATIHSLARFIGARSPVHLAWCTEVRFIPFKKTAKSLIGSFCTTAGPVPTRRQNLSSAIFSSERRRRCVSSVRATSFECVRFGRGHRRCCRP